MSATTDRAGTAVMTSLGNIKRRRGAPPPAAGCTLDTPSVATTASGRGSVAMKQGTSAPGASALMRATTSAIDPIAPLDSAHRRSASLATWPASVAPPSFGPGVVVGEPDGAHTSDAELPYEPKALRNDFAFGELQPVPPSRA